MKNNYSQRIKELGYEKITVTTIYKWNLSSQRMHEKLGFVKVDENDDEYIYELNLQEVKTTKQLAEVDSNAFNTVTGMYYNNAIQRITRKFYFM